MKQYQALLQNICETGIRKPNRTDVDTLSTFGQMMRFDLAEGFPCLTTKKVAWKWAARELLWFISGSHNARALEDQGVDIWKEWGDKGTREMGPIYGYQWRHWGGYTAAHTYGFSPATFEEGYDQLTAAVELVRKDPSSRRNIVTAWDPTLVPYQALPPCHVMFQLDVTDGRLNLMMYQRSCDTFLGVPFNVVCYALLTHLIAHVTGLKPGIFVWTGADTHLYLNHMDQVERQLSRTPGKLPRLVIKDRGQQKLDDFVIDDLELVGYVHQGTLAAEVAI